MVIAASDFESTFDSSAPAPIYLFAPHKAPKAKAASFEPLLADRFVNVITRALVDPGMKDMCYSAFYGDETDPAEVVSHCETLPFLTDRRVVFVRNADRYLGETATGPLAKYFQNPSPTTVLMLIASRVDKRSKMYKLCEQHAAVVECGALDERALRLWINQEAEARGKRFEPDAVREIIERAGGKLGEVNNAVTVVCGFVGERVTVHQKDVVAACTDVAEEEVWALTDAIAESNTAEAMRVLRSLSDMGKSEFEILGTINWLLKTAYNTATAQPGDPFLRSFPSRKCKPLADKLGLAKIKAAFHLLVEADFMLRSTGVDRGLALELLVIKLAAPRRRPAA